MIRPPAHELEIFVLYHLLAPLARYGGVFKIFNLFNYITFRAAGAFVTALVVAFVFGPMILRRLRAMAVHQVVRERQHIVLAQRVERARNGCQAGEDRAE